MAGGRASRQKGDRREREIVARHVGMGIKAARVPLSGAAGGAYSGDVDVYARGDDAAPLVTEVKARSSGEGFATIERWLGENDALFLVRDAPAPFKPAPEPLVVLPWRTWAEFIKTRGVKCK